MTVLPVQAVFFWRADMKSVFKATYGRKPKGTTYTKDFHQPRGDQARALERALGIAEGGDTPVEWRWPGGADSHGRFKPATDFKEEGGRMNLRWETDNAPPPWRLTPSPTPTSLSTLQGTPDLDDETKANAQLTALKATGEAPWLIAVHCYGEGPVLHARVVLENPASGREYASWDSLPSAVRNAMRRLRSDRPGGFVEFNKGYTVRAQKIVDQVLDAFETNPNVLLVGPPGTGKTVAMEDIRQAFVTGKSVTFDAARLHQAFDDAGALPSIPTEVRSLVFHPSYTYEDFVLGLLPEVAPNGSGVTVAPRVGPLLEMAHFARQPGQRALLVCDEFNRGAAASIFGDTLALLDADKRSDPASPGTEAVIETPYHHLAPKTHSGQLLDAQTSLPSTLHVLAAMNSADRSVAPLDAALRRRFAIIYVGPDYEILRDHLGVGAAFVKDHRTTPGDKSTWATVEHIKAVAVAVLEALNERIEAVLGRDFLLGHSVMWKVDGSDVPEALKSLATALDNNVLGTLALSFPDNDADLAAVLNADPGGTDIPSAAASWHAPPGRTAEVANSRLRPVRFRDLTGQELVDSISSLLG